MIYVYKIQYKSTQPVPSDHTKQPIPHANKIPSHILNIYPQPLILSISLSPSLLLTPVSPGLHASSPLDMVVSNRPASAQGAMQESEAERKPGHAPQSSDEVGRRERDTWDRGREGRRRIKQVSKGRR
jgi:hypothetical protein